MGQHTTKKPAIEEKSRNPAFPFSSVPALEVNYLRNSKRPYWITVEFYSQYDAQVAATIASAVETVRNSHEYSSAVYKDGYTYSYVNPVRNATAVGGFARIRFPYGVGEDDVLAFTHSHAMGFEAYSKHFEGATEEDYLRNGEIFSNDDLFQVYQSGIPLTLHTPSNDLRILSRQDSRPRFNETSSGRGLGSAPSQEVTGKIIDCKKAGF